MVDHEPQTFLDGKLLVSRKRRSVEISDIFTWTEAFTIFQMVMCATHPHRWPDLTSYTLLIIQTARQSPNRAWLEYDLAFHGDAAVGASVQVPRTAPLGTMVYAAGHLGNAASAMCAVHAMGTTRGLAAHFAPPASSPPPLQRGGSTE